MMYDVIVVGSGASGAAAARRLVDEGRQVLMLDVGNRDDDYLPLIPDEPFSSIRARDTNQHRYFLGDNREGIPAPGVRVGAQLTPPRQFITRDTDVLLPYESETFDPMQTLALGGLAAGWGAACFTFEADELARVGLDADGLRPYYDAVVQMMGVSGPKDDAISPEAFSAAAHAQPPSVTDSGGQALLNAYQKVRGRMDRRGFKLGRPPLALLTRDHEGRQANPGQDMEFWSDVRKSIFRPRYWIEDLQQKGNFTLKTRHLVVRFEQQAGVVTLFARHVDNGDIRTWSCKRVVLCAGALGSARIVLNSLKLFGFRVPLLCSRYTYIPCIQWRMLGREAADTRHSLAQLFALYDPHAEPTSRLAIQFYSYRSLLLFKLVKEIPLPAWAGLQVARLVMNSLVIAGVFHSDSGSGEKWMSISETKDLPGKATFVYREDPAVERAQERLEKNVGKVLCRLGCWAYAHIQSGNASSIHYGGTLPWGKHEDGGPVEVDADGRLVPMPGVFIGDSAPWRFLPSKGPTLTLMANALRIADRVHRDLPPS